MAARSPQSAPAVAVDAAGVRAYRIVRQGLDAEPSSVRDPADVAILDLGVQDTGTDGAPWALALRGAALTASTDTAKALVQIWSIRGAPHVYRRAQAAQIAAAVVPWSDDDAGKRIFDAAAKLRKANITIFDALDHVAAEMRAIAAAPVTKGEMSAALTERLAEPYLRWCRPCEATHAYEQTFRLAAIRGGLELEPGTSPPTLRRIPGWRGPAKTVPPRLDVVRAVLAFLGPATPKEVAGYVDTTMAEIKAHWPDDAVTVDVDGTRRWLLEADLELLEGAVVDPGQLRLLGNYDLFLQSRDREVVVPDAARRKQVWVILGRPGVILRGHEVVGTWRPRTKGTRFQLAVDEWTKFPKDSVEEQAQRLATHRGLTFAGLTSM